MRQTLIEFVLQVIQSKGFTVGFMLAVIVALGYDNYNAREREFQRNIKLEQRIEQKTKDVIECYIEQHEKTNSRLKNVEEQNQKILRILKDD